MAAAKRAAESGPPDPSRGRTFSFLFLRLCPCPDPPSHFLFPFPPIFGQRSLCGAGREERMSQWGQQETRELIAIRAELERDFTLSRRNKTVWEAVALRMREKGYRRTAERCKCKWKNLVNRYKLSYQIVDSVIWLGIRDIINQFRKKKLKLRPVTYLSGAQGSSSNIPHGYIWSPHLVPKPKGIIMEDIFMSLID